MDELKKDNNKKQAIETDRFIRLFGHMHGMLIIQRYMKFNREENRIERIPKEIINDKEEWIGDDKEIGLIQHSYKPLKLLPTLNTILLIVK